MTAALGEVSPWVLGRLSQFYATEWSDPIREWLFHPALAGAKAPDTGFEMLNSGAFTAPDNLCPVALVDEVSVACLILVGDEERGLSEGTIVRWFLTDVPPSHQLRILDTDIILYLESLEQELRARHSGLRRVLDEIGPAYQQSHIARDRRPRDYVVRPIRIACQNVIVGLAAIAQEASFDGLSVVAWQTCEVPHVATHEGNRALAALMLCDAFQSGGTMEIRFDREARVNVNGKSKVYLGHPERHVPASLRRYARTRGVALGAEDSAAISPSEARELFLAVTPMPAGLRGRVDRAVSSDGVVPERLCFLLQSQTWREIELDFILATSNRASSILKGGAPWEYRAARQAESEVCRAAAMVGMLYRRLNSTDSGGSDAEVSVVEDRTRDVGWSIDDVAGAVEFTGLDGATDLPWSGGAVAAESLVVYPRTFSLSNDSWSNIQDSPPGHVHAVLIPSDCPTPEVPPYIRVLRCPDRLADIDKAIEARLLTSRISRG